MEPQNPRDGSFDSLEKHFARELHDQIAQPLIALVLEIDELRGRLAASGDSQTADELEVLEESTRHILRSAREMMIDLRGNGELRLNFAELLRNELSGTVGHDFDLDVSSRWPKHINGWAAFNLLRIVQQAVSNASRHGRASSVDIFLDLNQEGEAVLVVLDNGAGLDGSPAGMGMIGMRERATILGGTFVVSPRETGGTRIEVRVPVTRLA